MKKLWISILVGLLALPMMFQAPVNAANVPISIIIDGVKLSTDRAPVMVNGRTMVPLRAIFEAFNATIKWNQKSQTVTATKDETTIMLKIGSKIATINNKAVTLDVPGQNLSGRTMVPTRFISEALGHKVGWNQVAKVVTITTSGGASGIVTPSSNVQVKDVSDTGDGRDLQISFNQSSNESLVDHYRVMIVKAWNTFSLSSAERVPSSNYSTVLAGTNPTIRLTANSRDVDGELIRSNQTYVAYVLAVGKGSNTSALSISSAAITLNNNTVAAPSSLQVYDVSDYSDGRDLAVSFNKVSDESKISSYRIFVVKASNYSSFTLGAANAVNSSNYTQVNKMGANITQILSSGARDVDGALIKTGVSYRVFVMGVDSASNAANNLLSAASSAITLSSVNITNLSVSDVSDYGDGRDLKVSFNHATDETYISQYRILIVPTAYYNSFSLSEANNVPSSYYTTVSTAGSSTSQVLASSARDVRGDVIKNGTPYRVYVLAVGSGKNLGTNILSTEAPFITLILDYRLSPVSNLVVSDVNDYEDGRDLQVSFNHATDETYINQYRILVVPTSYYSSFSLSQANNVSSSNYTSVGTSGSSTSQVLTSSARDVNGTVIKSGTSYKVYVLTVGSGKYSGTNVLSSESNAVTLSTKLPVKSVTNVTYSVDDGKILIRFTPSANESNISEYRVLVVPAKQGFGSAEAIAVKSPYFTSITPNGTNPAIIASKRDVNGALIVKGVKYRVYVLAVANNNGLQNGGLSVSTDEFEI
ncbi:copper amine oxidase N-terminal domain-containing protein [Paenibacillus sp. HW567]|uniref:copper amine oxidase N-terminal domain-containing protein n=1 Tax=Paenibacillus sp. HW567 TaxID=1034769 RepID=UPI0003607BCD|nr:copper amine oxidase N-terminal domain-containing protein [Paenibacillus sp. HW567]